jgi:acyl carrier protein
MREKILEVIKKVFELDEVPDDISQKNCDKWDSLNHLNLVVELESTFNVEFEPEEIAEMKDVDSIEKIIKSRM